LERLWGGSLSALKKPTLFALPSLGGVRGGSLSPMKKPTLLVLPSFGGVGGGS